MAERWEDDNMRKTATRSRVRQSPRRDLRIGEDIETSYFFMLNCFLHSRIHTGIESNTECYDEDVNVYIAHLLNAHVSPGYLERVSSTIAQHDADLREMVEQSGSERARYEIYKANADFLLMGVAVFDMFDHHDPLRPEMHTPKEILVGRAAAYYAIASASAAKLGAGTNALSETLAKISQGIDRYVRVLSYMRGQYLGLIRPYSAGELFHLDRAIEEIQRGEAIERQRNEFLDTFQEWRKTGMKSLKKRLAEQAELLREIDPTFRFKPPS